MGPPEGIVNMFHDLATGATVPTREAVELDEVPGAVVLRLPLPGEGEACAGTMGEWRVGVGTGPGGIEVVVVQGDGDSTVGLAGVLTAGLRLAGDPVALLWRGGACLVRAADEHDRGDLEDLLVLAGVGTLLAWAEGEGGVVH